MLGLYILSLYIYIYIYIYININQKQTSHLVFDYRDCYIWYETTSDSKQRGGGSNSVFKYFFLMEGLVSIGEHIKIRTKVKKKNSTQPFTV